MNIYKFRLVIEATGGCFRDPYEWLSSVSDSFMDDGYTVTRKSFTEIKVTPEELSMIQHHRQYGCWPKEISPKKLGANEYKRLHKRLKKLIGVVP